MTMKQQQELKVSILRLGTNSQLLKTISAEGADRREAIILSLVSGTERTDSQKEVMDKLQVVCLYFTIGKP
jgi:hypothetical protein